MKANIDWSVLKAPIVVFVICLLISSSVVSGTWYFKENMLKKYNADKRRFQTISNQYLAVDQEEQLIRQYYPRFIKLYENGIVGQEQRLNWIETLRASGEYIKLPGLKYTITSQKQFTPDFAVNTGSFNIYSSPMKLILNLLHEGDLEELLSSLNKHARGLYNLSRCEFAGKSTIDLKNASNGNITAECELTWFNIKKSDGSEINIKL